MKKIYIGILAISASMMFFAEVKSDIYGLIVSATLFISATICGCKHE